MELEVCKFLSRIVTAELGYSPANLSKKAATADCRADESKRLLADITHLPLVDGGDRGISMAINISSHGPHPSLTISPPLKISPSWGIAVVRCKTSRVAVLPHHPKAHYLPLDSIRGIAAVSIVVHHFVISKTFDVVYPEKAWIDIPFFHNAWLFVDLFFVLSGMVISLSYAQADFGTFSLREFMTRRLARIYPLHIVMLLVLLALRLLRLGLVAGGVVATPPAEFEVNNAYSFFLNVFLLQSLGFLNYLSWNGPSWSISTEFYTYLFFGLVLLCARQVGSRMLFLVLSFLLAICSWLLIVFVLGRHSLDSHYEFGLIRCVISFFMGVLTVKAASSLSQKHHEPTLAQSLLQISALLVSLLLVDLVGERREISLVAPLAFAILLGSLMAFPRAWPLPSLLAIPPLVWLGKRSYSIYMVHAAVLLLLEYAARGIAHRLQVLDSAIPGLPATLNLLLLVALVLALSELTYRYVEGPGSRVIRKLFERREAMVPPALTADAGARPS